MPLRPKLLLSSFLVSTFLSCAAYAACTPDQTLKQRELHASLKDAVTELTRAKSRLNGQVRRIEALGIGAESVSPKPVEPERHTPTFDARGRLTLDCDDTEAVEATLLIASDEVLIFSTEVELYIEGVEAREAEVIALEEAAEKEAETAQPEPDDQTVPQSSNQDEGSGATDQAQEQPQEGDGEAEQTGKPLESDDEGTDQAKGNDGTNESDEGTNQADGNEGSNESDEGQTDQADGSTGDDEQRAEPLKVDDNDLVYQRLLTLPEAAIRSEPTSDDDAVQSIPAFSVLYVYDRAARGGADWIQVGPGIAGGPTGWIREDQTLAWNSALVMQFAPVGKRERVLFFRDSGDLIDVITDFQFATEAKGFYKRLKEGALEEDRFVAAEPATAVRYEDEPYLLPIIDHIEEAFDDASEVTLVKVASVSLNTEKLEERDTESLERKDEDQGSANLEDFRIGITFVIDSTASMGPYIERTHDAVRAIYSRFEGMDENVQASFGLVAYRDNYDHDNRIRYVTEIVQPLDIEASPKTILANIDSVQPSPAATVDWREDAYAGVASAIESFDWSPFTARIVILITDAGAREGADKLASRTDLTTSVLVQDAVAKNIAIIPIHLITPEAEAQNDVGRAEDQYRRLSQTGDENNQKYLALDATSDAEFAREIDSAAEFLANEILRLARSTSGGDAAEGNGESNDGDQQSDEPAVQDGTLKSDQDDGGAEAGPQGKLANVLATEILRARLEYLGGKDEAGAPSFVSGWAADRDLTDPQKRTLKFSVFLTRNQISALAQSVEQLVDAFRSAGTSPGAFFDQLQLVAAKTARDPDLVRQDEKAAVREILPSFIQGLPYLSEVLRLDRELWEQFSTADRENFVEGLEEKLRVYNRLYEQTESWVDFGAGDPALEAYAMPLEKLP